MKEIKIFGYSGGDIEFIIVKLPNGKLRKFAVKHNNQFVAFFDTEEKVRLYSEGLQKGIDWGYSAGYDKFKK